MALKINDRITLKNNVCGVVRYIGPVEGREDEWVGIELEEERGTNDGEVGNKRYFKCLPGHGMFVKYKRLANNITELNQNYTDIERMMKNKNYQDNQKKQTYNIKGDLNQSRTDKFNKSTSLFESDINDEEIHKEYDNECNDTGMADIKKQLEDCKIETKVYREKMNEFITKCMKSLHSVYNSLKEIEKRIDDIKILSIEDTERRFVVELVEAIYIAEKNNDDEKLYEYYKLFKEIMHKHNISC